MQEDNANQVVTNATTLGDDFVHRFLDTILSDRAEVRNRSFESLCQGLSLSELRAAASGLDKFRRQSDNLYHQVRALFFLTAIYRYVLPDLLEESQTSYLPFDAYERLLDRRTGEAIDQLLEIQHNEGPSHLISTSLAKAYHQLAFQRLADQVRRSVRTVRGNQWMFRIGHPADYPLRLDKRLLKRDSEDAPYPILQEQTSVRMDFSHSGWSDIFFLGMDFPEGARVLNASIDLAVESSGSNPRPPVQAFVRVIDRPVLRLVSVDLQAEVDITKIDDVFDFAKDYLGLLKAAVIASGIVPPGMEGCHREMSELLRQFIGAPNLGLEIVSHVNNIPKGSRLAVSTNLLGSLIAALMRASRQVANFTDPLSVDERRLITARAILGEWLGGSGGGWQDSGGIWPGIKLICGAIAGDGDIEQGVSRGRLLPQHEILKSDRISEDARRKLEDSLVLIYGGMAQNVGPILEMVTEKYLLRSEKEWQARQLAMSILDQIVDALQKGDIRRVGALTTENFTDALQAIIPWCTNAFTNRMIDQCRTKYGEQFWGFWMLGGMSGGGMGFLFDPAVRTEAEAWLGEALVATKRAMQTQLPFAMDPVVFKFAINDQGTAGSLLENDDALMPSAYYAARIPRWLRSNPRDLSPQSQHEWMRLSKIMREDSRWSQWMLEQVLPTFKGASDSREELHSLLKEHGFDGEMHQQLRDDLRNGRIGLAQNRLSSQAMIEDVKPEHVIDLRDADNRNWLQQGERAIVDGEVAVVSLAAGVGSRWTGGAGVVKGLHPFCQFAGEHRNFIEVHLAKTQSVIQKYRTCIPHVLTTGYMTHEPIREFLEGQPKYDNAVLSKGMSVGLRLIPTPRDLRFLWEEMPQQVLDEQQQKVRQSGHAALIHWAEAMGPGNDYVDNLPMQCMHPVGHWYEIPNMLLNGTLNSLLAKQPQLKYLMLHNIDTLGASIDPQVLGCFIDSDRHLGFEVVSRRIDDRGGGLALVDGRPRLVEGLAMPNERDEFKLTYYNSMTTWISIDGLLDVFGLQRKDLESEESVRAAVRRLASRLPTYITIKDVKKRWGQAQEDVYPVTQFEKLWGDMSGLSDVSCCFLAVPIQRGQQLKDVAQLDGWVRDGSWGYVNSLCAW